MHGPFIPGLQLCRAFYFEAVRPLLADAYPGLRYSAARLGPGSDVLGFDTERSVDHDWGPRLDVFLSEEDVERYRAPLTILLAQRLPKQFRGWPTNFEPPDGRVRVATPTGGPVAHRVETDSVASWGAKHLGFDPRHTVSTLDWLATPGQRLAEFAGGDVFHDGLGELESARAAMGWYPLDVWRYLLACQWTRIAEEEAFVGRAHEAGDSLGSRVVAARLAREVMRLCLLLARRYPPYSKWLGTAFAALPEAVGIAGALEAALRTDDAAERQSALCSAYEAAGDWQNSLGIASTVESARRPYFDRPYPVLDAARFAAALSARIEDPTVAALPLVGAVDQFADSTTVLCRPDLARALMTAVWATARG